MKLNPLVSNLRLYDIRLAPGVAADIDHINTASKVCCLCLYASALVTLKRISKRLWRVLR